MTRAGLIAWHLLREVPLAVLCTLLARELMGPAPSWFAAAQAGLLGWTTGHLVLVAVERHWGAVRLSLTTVVLSLVFTTLGALSLQAVARPSQRADSS